MLANPTPIGEYAPDAPPLTPGALPDMDGWFPTMRGLRTLPTYTIGGATLPSPALGAGYSLALTNGQRLTIAGTADHLYLLQGAAWIEFDAGQTFHTTRHWHMATFGNDILACNMVDPPQISRNTAPFVPLASVSDVALLFLAGHVAVVPQGVFFGEVDGTRWGFSFYDDVWTGDIATGTVYGSLNASPGPIRAICPVRGGVIFYKSDSIYFAQFTGPPFYWQFTLISNERGLSGHFAVVNTGDRHFFPSGGDFYVTDGSSLQPVPNQLAETFFRATTEEQLDSMTGFYDQHVNLATWVYGEMGALTTKLLYNTRSGKWAKSSLYDTEGSAIAAEVIVLPNYSTENLLSYEDLGARIGVYETIPEESYTELCGGLSSTVISHALITSDHALATQSGTSVSAWILGNEIGDGNSVVQVNGLRPLFAQYPGSAHLQTYVRMNFGTPLTSPDPFPPPTSGPDAWLTQYGNFDFIAVGRSHQWRIEVFGEAEITAVAADLQFAGRQ